MKRVFFALLALVSVACTQSEELNSRVVSPTKAHPSPTQLISMEAVDATLSEAKKAYDSGCEDVEFLISYLERVKALRAKCKSSDSFAQQLILSYPTLPAAENIRTIAKSLYPDEVESSEALAIKGRVQDYFNMVSNLDTDIAKGLWSDRDDISIITPRNQFVGYDAIMNDFLIKSFSTMSYRKLSSISEVVNIYGDSANVQLYWIFDTKDAEGVAHQTRGRESLIFSKIAGEWRLVHVHYSRMP